MFSRNRKTLAPSAESSGGVQSSSQAPSDVSKVYWCISADGKESTTLAYPKREEDIGATTDLAKEIDLTLANATGKPSKSKRFSRGPSSSASHSGIDAQVDKLASNASSTGSFGATRVPSKSWATMRDLKGKLGNPYIKGVMVVSSHRPSDFSEAPRSGQFMACHGILSPTLFGEERERERKGLSSFANHVAHQARTFDVSMLSFEHYEDRYNQGRYGHIVMTGEEQPVFEGIEDALDLTHVSPGEVNPHDRHETAFNPQGSGGNSDFNAAFASHGR